MVSCSGNKLPSCRFDSQTLVISPIIALLVQTLGLKSWVYFSCWSRNDKLKVLAMVCSVGGIILDYGLIVQIDVLDYYLPSDEQFPSYSFMVVV